MREINLLYSISISIFRIIFRLFYRVRVSGIDNAAMEGPVLIYSNHLGMLDMFLISYKYYRVVHYMAKAELLEIPVLGSWIKGVGSFSVDRGAGDLKAVKQTLKFLKEGKVVGIFPEGTRTRKKRRPRVKGGAALFALRSGATIQPVAIKGSYKIFSKIDVVFGEPYKIEKEKDKQYEKEELIKISTEIMDGIYNLIEKEEFTNENYTG